MSKTIRPITAYKRANPEFYNLCNSSVLHKGIASKKQQENRFYYSYAFHNSNTFKKDTGIKENKFWFGDDGNTKVNVCTITEMGRILLYGWYYDIVNFTLDICQQIYNAYNYKVANGLKFNDMEFSKALILLRENLGYYYHNQDEYKIFLLKFFFEKEVQKLLPPPPEKYQRILDIDQKAQKKQANNIKKDPNYYTNKVFYLEQYVEYLHSIIAGAVDYYSFEEFTKIENKERNKFWDEHIKKVKIEIEDHKEKCKAILLQTNLLT